MLIPTLFLTQSSFASFDFGAGVGGGTAGRTNLALVMSIESESGSFGGYISGVKSSYYYQSEYYLAANWKLVSSSFIWGELKGYFGLGAYYSERGLRANTVGEVEEKVGDFALGPSIKMKWLFAGPIYLSLDAMYGLRNLGSHVMLSFQDIEVLSLGWSF